MLVTKTQMIYLKKIKKMIKEVLLNSRYDYEVTDYRGKNEKGNKITKTVSS